jgi:CRP-like cAMP-binding protein
MCEILRIRASTILNLAAASPEVRIRHILIQLAGDQHGPYPVMITARRQDIAEMTGLSTETAIRVIRRLSKQGILRIEHGKIFIDRIDLSVRFP